MRSAEPNSKPGIVEKGKNKVQAYGTKLDDARTQNPFAYIPELTQRK
jgi:hypothetical protein